MDAFFRGSNDVFSSKKRKLISKTAFIIRRTDVPKNSMHQAGLTSDFLNMYAKEYKRDTKLFLCIDHLLYREEDSELNKDNDFSNTNRVRMGLSNCLKQKTKKFLRSRSCRFLPKQWIVRISSVCTHYLVFHCPTSIEALTFRKLTYTDIPHP